MTKSQLKKEIQALSKEQLIEQILGLFDANKPVKDYLKTFLNPDNYSELFEKYKNSIINKFNPEKISRNMRICYSVAKKAIDYKYVKYANDCGGGFSKEINDVIEEYY